MKNIKIVIMVVIFSACMFLFGCDARKTIFDPYLSDEDCFKFGFNEIDCSYYYAGSYIYYINVTLDETRIIKSIYVYAFSGPTRDNQMVGMIFDSSGNLIARSADTIAKDSGGNDSDAWTRLDIPDTTLAPGNYRLGAIMRFNDGGMAFKKDAGTVYKVSSSWTYPNPYVAPSSISTGTPQSFMLRIYGNYCE